MSRMLAIVLVAILAAVGLPATATEIAPRPIPDEAFTRAQDYLAGMKRLAGSYGDAFARTLGFSDVDQVLRAKLSTPYRFCGLSYHDLKENGFNRLIVQGYTFPVVADDITGMKIVISVMEDDSLGEGGSGRLDAMDDAVRFALASPLSRDGDVLGIILDESSRYAAIRSANGYYVVAADKESANQFDMSINVPVPVASIDVQPYISRQEARAERAKEHMRHLRKINDE